MARIGAYDAKTHLPKLLERVQRGERFVITKHGRPVAELGPVVQRDAGAIQATIARMRKGRENLERRGFRLRDLLGRGESLRDFIHRGHRY